MSHHIHETGPIMDGLMSHLTFSSIAGFPDLSANATMTPMLASRTSGAGSFADFIATGRSKA